MLAVKIVPCAVDAEEIAPLLVLVNAEPAVGHHPNTIRIPKPVVVAGIAKAPHRSPHWERVFVHDFQIVRLHENGRAAVQIHPILVEVCGIRHDFAEVFQRVAAVRQVKNVNSAAGAREGEFLPLIGSRPHEPFNHALRDSVELADPFVGGVVNRHAFNHSSAPPRNRPDNTSNHCPASSSCTLFARAGL